MYLAGPVHSLHLHSKKNLARCAFPIPIQSPPPGISNWLKNIWPPGRYTFSHTNICSWSYKIHTPRVFLGTWETIHASKKQGTFFLCPWTHSDCNHQSSLLHPYAMGHCWPLCFHGLWNIRAILAEGKCQGVTPSNILRYNQVYMFIGSRFKFKHQSSPKSLSECWEPMF